MINSIFLDGNTLVESMNIMYYLEERFPDTHRLLPVDRLLKARVREISEVKSISFDSFLLNFNNYLTIFI